MRKLLLVPLALALATGRAMAQDPMTMMHPPTPPQIAVAGQGEVRVVPDRATLTLGVQSRGRTAAVASADNSRRQGAIIDTLRAMGLTSEQISTANYTVYPETRYDTTSKRTVVTGYFVSNTVRVELRSVDQVGRVIDGALAKGANQISSLDFYQSNPDSTRRVGLAQAITRARADAEVIARAAGGTLGKLLEVQANDMSGPPIIRKSLEMFDTRAAGAPTPIEPGSEMFRVMVNARWEFVPGPR